jgi:hypothetical protein
VSLRSRDLAKRYRLRNLLIVLVLGRCCWHLAWWAWTNVLVPTDWESYPAQTTPVPQGTCGPRRGDIE